MATKNLARTVLEAGRSSGFKSESRATTRQERAMTRSFLALVRRDPEQYDEEVVPCRMPIRANAGSEKFAPDKLAPAHRWLDKRVGTSWDQTRSELRKKFDARTTPGRHVLFDHLLPLVEPLRYVPLYPDYLVAPDGTLMRGEPRPRYGSYRREDMRKAVSKDELHAWLAGRKIGSHGRHCYWFVTTHTFVRECVERFCDEPRIRIPEARRLDIISEFEKAHTGRRFHYFTPPDPHAHRVAGAYRQNQELGPDDIAFFRKLTTQQRKTAMVPKKYKND